MKSLVDVAKELGFTPNPTMKKDDWQYLIDALGTYFLFEKSGLSPDHKLEQRRIKNPHNIADLVYHTNCIQKRGGLEDIIRKNIELLKSRDNKDAFPAPQTIPGDLNTTSFIWHHPKNANGDDMKERFTADINMGSRIFPAMLKKLDAFAKKYQSSFKFANLHTRHRVDTFNLYMTRDITPEIAQEFYDIVKPCLKSTHHDRLNGQEIYIGNTPVKGVKIGPILNGSRDSYDEREAHKDNWVRRDIQNSDLREIADGYLKDWLGREPKSDGQPITQPSLGSVSTSVELMNLMYYMLGKEGQNPFQLVGYDNKPYQKHLTITDTQEKEKAPMVSFWQKMTSAFQKKEGPKPQSTFDWTDSKLWSDVQVAHGDEIRNGHRINIQNLTQEQRDQIKADLEKRHIKFTERNATSGMADIKPGDLTIRITDPDSVWTLRHMVFAWAEGPHTRPITQSRADYEAGQKLIREKRAPKTDTAEKPKWADSKYWGLTSHIENGKLEQTYVMDLGDPNDHLHDNPQPFGSGAEIVKALADKGIAATVGRGISNGLPAYMMTHDSVVISGVDNIVKFGKVFLHQSDKAFTPPARNNGGR